MCRVSPERRKAVKKEEAGARVCDCGRQKGVVCSQEGDPVERRACRVGTLAGEFGFRQSPRGEMEDVG